MNTRARYTGPRPRGEQARLVDVAADPIEADWDDDPGDHEAPSWVEDMHPRGAA